MRRRLPQSFETGCQFDTDFLPDSKSCPAEYLSTVFSLPQWLVAGWIDEFGEESTKQICLASNRRPSVYIRPNTLRTTIEALAKKLAAAEVGFEIVSEAEMICIKGPRDITRLTGFAEGLFTVQDITASKPVRMLMHCRFPIAECRFSNRKWKIVNRKFLDLCAAPGTKTTQLAEVTCDSARIVATDIDNKRLEMVRENVIRLGMNHIDVVPYEELPGISDFRLPNADFQIANRKSQIANSFDCVLLDVPCSNTGVLAKRVEARYRISPQAIKKLLRTQAGLLNRRRACKAGRTDLLQHMQHSKK
jgi:16S rRNA (cytosine967-C5)-methyltransferase